MSTQRRGILHTACCCYRGAILHAAAIGTIGQSCAKILHHRCASFGASLRSVSKPPYASSSCIGDCSSGSVRDTPNKNEIDTLDTSCVCNRNFSQYRRDIADTGVCVSAATRCFPHVRWCIPPSFDSFHKKCRRERQSHSTMSSCKRDSVDKGMLRISTFGNLSLWYRPRIWDQRDSSTFPFVFSLTSSHPVTPRHCCNRVTDTDTNPAWNADFVAAARAPAAPRVRRHLHKSYAVRVGTHSRRTHGSSGTLCQLLDLPQPERQHSVASNRCKTSDHSGVPRRNIATAIRHI